MFAVSKTVHLVRRATPEDSAAILDCLHSAFEPYRETYTAAAFADTTLDPATLVVRFGEMAVFVAENPTGGVVGTVALSVSGREGHIRGMAVRPAWQGRSVAEALLGHVEAEALAAGVIHISLDTTAPLQRAIRFYERHGFRPTGKVSDFFGMPLYGYAKTL